MENKEKNPEVVEESKEVEKDLEESEAKEESPKAVEESIEESESDGEDTSKLEQDLKALKGTVSGKDKQLKAVEEENETLSERLQKLEDQSKVKDLLMEADYPESVKKALREDLNELSPDNFEASAEKYKSLYEQGVEEQKAKSAEFVSKKPEPKVPADFQEQIKGAQNEEELRKIVDEAGV